MEVTTSATSAGHVTRGFIKAKSKSFRSFNCFLYHTMSGLYRRPSGAQSKRLLSSLSLAFVALLAVFCFTSPVVKAEEASSEYGTVIGIGT